MKAVWIAVTTVLSTSLLLSACESPSRETESKTPGAAETIGQGAQVTATDGVSIHYRVAGSGDPALFFVHCWSCDLTYWEPQIEHFSARHQVVAIDLAGHGRSSAGRSPWTIEAFAEDVRTVAEHRGLEQVILIGHSLGGPVVVEAARRMPERVIAVIGVDTLQDVRSRDSEQEWQQFRRLMEEDFAGVTEEWVRTRMFPPGTDPDVAQRISTDMASAPPEVAIAVLDAAWRHNLTAAYSELKCPIRVINSAFLMGRHPVRLEEIRKLAPQFEVVTMNRVGHFPQLEAPEEFNRLLEDSIQAVTAPPASGR